MLQWMGGSRRKVTTSRKSTQNRQKKYFEQRKRQQQTAQLESDADGSHKYVQHDNKPRSLDIISLANLATISEKCSHRDARESPEAGDTQEISHVMHCSRNAFSKNIVPGDSVDWSRRRRSSSHELETSCHQKFSNKDGDKVDDWKKKNSSNNYLPNRSVDKPDKTADELSLLDLLDDGPQRNISENLMPEDHVAFSVEGLGRIGMDTPVHTPRQPSKTSSNAFSFLPKFTKKLKFISSDIDFGLNAMMGDIKTVRDGNSPGWNSMAEGSMQHNSCDSPVDNIFTVDKDFGYVSEQKREKNWTVGSSMSHVMTYLMIRNMALQQSINNFIRTVSADLPKVQNFETYDIEDQFFMNRRNAVDANRELDITELSGPHSRHTTFGNDNELGSGWRRCTRTTGNLNFENVISEPSWPYLETEDSVDSKSLLSEGSCSSAAEQKKLCFRIKQRGKETKQEISWRRGQL
ncbi:hypothetical protein QJS10_CPA01g02215 [Acorus calamus]|uniref:Uncharacterized protein n=1 Tax=Acorus calamus TaxID=4465 RepID=A0AAV9FE98_ACOCL|nr:hypothetical protein QJS10_CPA01g02215 [Acorus calamus]